MKHTVLQSSLWMALFVGTAMGISACSGDHGEDSHEVMAKDMVDEAAELARQNAPEAEDFEFEETTAVAESDAAMDTAETDAAMATDDTTAESTEADSATTASTEASSAATQSSTDTTAEATTADTVTTNDDVSAAQ